MAYVIFISLLFTSLLRRPVTAYIFGFSLITTLTLYGSSKALFSDWAWYYRHFVYLYENGLVEYFRFASYPYDILSPMLGVRPRLSEPVAYFIAYIVQIAFSSNQETLAAAFHFLFYSNIILAVRIYFGSKPVGDHAGTVALALAASILIVPNFTLAIHLLRQELALVFILVGVVGFFSQRIYLSASFLSLAILTHNSSAVFVILILLCVWAVKRQVKFFTFALMTVITAVMLRILVDGNWTDVDKNDGAIGFFTILLDGGLLVIYLVSVFAVRLKANIIFSNIDLSILYLSFALAIVMISVSDLALIALRFYFYLDILCFLYVFRIVQIWFVGKAVNPLITAFVVFIGFTYVYLSIYRSPLPYYSDFLSTLFLS